jgi:hypothetical protein
MNLDLNLTLLFQVFNFFISYFMITRLLLKPVYNIILDEERNIEDLKNKIKTELINFNSLKLRFKDEELLKKEYFINSKPHLVSRLEFLNSYNNFDINIEFKKFNKDYILDQVKDISKVLEAKIVDIK